MQLNAVVLPAPLGPMSPTISNSLTSRLTSCSACRPPKRIDRSRTSSTDTGALHHAEAAVDRVAVQAELLALEPPLQRRDALPDATRVEDERLQEQHRADETCQRSLVGAVVAVEHRDVLRDVHE